MKDFDRPDLADKRPQASKELVILELSDEELEGCKIEESHSYSPSVPFNSKYVPRLIAACLSRVEKCPLGYNVADLSFDQSFNVGLVLAS